jgi:hypothetical protein
VAPLAVAGLSFVLAASLAACGTSHETSRRPPLGEGTLPAFLLKTTTPVDRVVTASASRPQLAVQGVAVRVDLPNGQVLANVTGPQVPPFVAPPPPEVTAIFDVSLSRASGSVPVQLSDFSITDQLGRTFSPTLVVGEKPPPAAVSPGQAVTFRLTAVLPTGEGRIHWSPTAGQPFVSWDFIVEND